MVQWGMTGLVWAFVWVDVKMEAVQTDGLGVNDAVNHDQLHNAAAAAELGLDASELHGLLVGYLCGGGKVEPHQTLVCLGLEGTDGDALREVSELLEQARQHCMGQLQELNMGLEPLLPADDCPLRERVDALLEWTRGFLGGFGLAGADASRLTADGKEVLHDLGTIAATHPTLEKSSGQAAHDDESAWMELMEFVRVGGMLLHAEVISAGSKAHGSDA